MTRIGYLVPEFPGQTHIFFWRELKELKRLGLRPDILSTRRPAKRIVSHCWSQEAMEETTYLFPPKPAQLLWAALQILLAGPLAWYRCGKTIATSDVSGLRAKLRLFGLVLLGARLGGIARQREWSHLHVHSCADAANIALFAHLLTGLEYSMTLHGPLADYGPNQRAKWKHCKFGVVITQKLFDEVQQQLSGHLPQLHIAPMGVELNRFQRSAPYVPFTGIGPLHIFACGRINPCKGHEFLVEAVAQLREEGIDARLGIAGAIDTNDDHYYRLLRERIEQLKVEDSVELLGAVPEEDVQSRLEQAHVFALASLHEPLGVVYMEAMAMELPVVATNAGGVSELITNGVDGILVAPQSSRQVADAIEKIAESPEWACELGRKGRQRVEKDFHSGVSANVLYQGIVDEGSGIVDDLDKPLTGRAVVDEVTEKHEEVLEVV